MTMFSKTKYFLVLFSVLGLYLITNCTTKYIERPPTFGSILVESIPDSADIFLDNQPTGKTTPDTLFDVPTGAHQISISKEWYLSSPNSMIVDVLENQITTASFELFDINYGFLYVSSTPESARIIIDNQFSEEYTPHLFDNDIPTDTHIISISMDDHATDLPSKYVVDITTTDTVQLDFGLTPAEEGKEEGKLAWDFDLLDDFNNRIVLSNYRGFIVLIVLWSEHCHYCMMEIDSLQTIYQEYQADSLIIFGINYEDDLSVIKNIRTSHNLTFTLLVGKDSDIVNNNYKPGGPPVTVILNRTGIVYYYRPTFNPGFVNWFRAKLNELLGK